jgi:hypothetical protein
MLSTPNLGSSGLSARTSAFPPEQCASTIALAAIEGSACAGTGRLHRHERSSARVGSDNRLARQASVRQQAVLATNHAASGRPLKQSRPRLNGRSDSGEGCSGERVGGWQIVGRAATATPWVEIGADDEGSPF